METISIGKKHIILTIILSIIAFFIYFLFYFFNQKTVIVFCDVGQGDGAYIRIKNKIDLVIDAGPNKQILNCLGRYMPFWDKKIELAILTHPNKDHYGGFFYLIDRYQIDYFLTVESPFTSLNYQLLLNKIKNKKILTIYKTQNEKIFFKDVKRVFLEFFWPPKNLVSSEDNDYSLVFIYQEGFYRVLFTGDASNFVLNNLLKQPISNINILKIPHHGSKNGLTKNFLLLAKPMVAVISVGKNNQYGHPSKIILDMLQAQKIKVKRTDKQGNIVFRL